MKAGLLTLLTLTALCGCAVRGASLDGTYDGLSGNYPGDAQLFAEQAAQELAKRYPVGQTTLNLVSVPGQFGISFEQELRQKGFAVTTQSGTGTRIGYILDEIQEENIPTGYLKLRTTDGTDIALLRPLKGVAVQPKAIPTPKKSAPPAKEKPDTAVSAPLKSQISATGEVPPPAPASSSLASKPSSILQDMPKPEATTQNIRPKGHQNMLFPKAVLTVLPYDWKYTIPDQDKRSRRVSWPKNAPWREAIQSMADEAGCETRFDEKAKRVTLVAAETTASSSVSTPVKVSALHPALLEKQAPSQAKAPSSSPKTVATSPATSSTPKVVQDALKDAQTATHATASKSLPTLKISKPAVPLSLAPKSEAGEAKVVTPPLPTWNITPGALKAQMESWAEKAGYRLIWKADYDYMMQAPSTFRGDFIQAVGNLFEQLHLNGTSVRVKLYQDNKIMEVRQE